MRAVIRSGGDMTLKEDYNVPKYGDTEVLVKVMASAINPIDYKLRWPIGGPVVGIDFSGIIEQVGSKVENFQVGDEVYGKSKGSLAELAVARCSEIGKKPTSISHGETAAMPVTYLTSLQVLRDSGALEKNGRVLIIGASGGCGISATQLATALGAGEIVGVCSGKNEEFVKSHGVHHVIDYTKDDILTYCQNGEGVIVEDNKFDIVYDAATASGGGEDYKAKSMQVLKGGTPKGRHGQYVAINGSMGMWIRKFTIGCQKNQHLVLCNTNSKDLNFLAGLVDEGKLKPVIAELLPFDKENVEKGFNLLKSRRVVGKIVFEINKTE